MSVVVVKADELCEGCAAKSHSLLDGGWGTLRVYMEMNDMCWDCVDKEPSLIVRDTTPDEAAIAKMVRSKSPYLRRMRRQRWRDGIKKDFKEPYVYLFLVTLLLAAFLMGACGYAAWSLVR